MFVDEDRAVGGRPEPTGAPHRAGLHQHRSCLRRGRLTQIVSMALRLWITR